MLPPPPLFRDFSGSLHVLAGTALEGPSGKSRCCIAVGCWRYCGVEEGGESVQLGARGRWPNGGEGGMNSRASGH